MRKASKSRIKKTKHPHIVKVKGVCGGSAIVKGTRTSVWSIVEYNRTVGYSPNKIVAHLPHLTLAQVHDALAYYYDNQDEIDRDLATNREEFIPHRHTYSHRRLPSKVDVS